MPHTHAFTIASNNYLAMAKVFAESYREHHPGAEVFVCIADRPDSRVPYGRMPFVPIFAEEIGIPAFGNFAFRYDILELNTAVKPFVFSYLRERHGLDRAFYFDPDILVHDTLTGLEEALDRHPAVLTPHITRSLDDSYLPAERNIVMAGIYNLGFLGLRLDDGTAEFLEWWKDRLYRFCVNDIHNGLFVDQTWMGLAPAFLEDVAIAREPIYNVAYWNLGQRRPVLVKDPSKHRAGDHWEIEGRRAGFFHFSGIDFDHLDLVSRHQNRLTLHDRPELRPLFEDYRRRVYDAGHERLRGLPYGFLPFRDSDVSVPSVARRMLQRVDPRGRKWPDPFDLHRDDSYFNWLVEPLPFALGYLNRAVLALWEQRDDLVRTFPDPLGEDLPRLVDWLVNYREGEHAGLHPIFLEGVRTRAKPPERRSTFSPRLHPYATVAVEKAGDVLARLDLARPGAMTAWLNEPIPGTAQSRPIITRLALLLYKVRTDVQERFPDPLEANQADLAYWFCRFAAREFQLDPALVAPVLRTLPLGRRLPLAWHRFQNGHAAPAGAAEAAEAGVPALPASPAPAAHGPVPRVVDREAPWTGHPPLGRRGATLGVNLAGYFAMATGIGQIARGSAEALSLAGVPLVQVHLDQDLAAKLVDGRVHHPEGAPYPLTLMHANADQTPHVLSSLPLAGTAGGFKIGYWFWELSHFPLALGEAFGHLNEVWAPSRFCERSFEAIATVPVRYVPPCVPPPQAAAGSVSRSRYGMEEGRFYFLLCFDVQSIPERKNPFGAIEAIRRLLPRTRRPVGLMMKVTRAGQNPELVAHLREAAQGLPIVLHTDPASRCEMDSLVGLCDANLSLHRSEGLGLLPIESLYLGKPVVATGYGGVTDFLDEETGFPVRHEVSRLERDYAPYPRGSVWAEPDLEHAVERMLEVLENPAEAARRGEAGRRRVEALYGPEAASKRLAAELHRAFEQMAGD